METVIISGGNTAEGVNLRSAASTKKGLIIAKIPQGTEVKLLEGGGEWNYVQYGDMKGYVMSSYVHKKDEITDEEMSTIDTELAKIEAALEAIRAIVGRG